MNYLSKINKTPRAYLVAFALLGLMVLGSLMFSLSVNAQGSSLSKAEALKVCERKVNPDSCRDRVEKCPAANNQAASDCRRNAVRVGEGIADDNNPGDISFEADRTATDTCGEGENAVEMSINFGCTGKGNPIVDMAYAIVRFLSFGVALVLVASIIYAGIQYTSSTGNPEQTSAAKKRITNAFIALIFYMLIFAFIQYLVPGGLFN